MKCSRFSLLFIGTFLTIEFLYDDLLQKNQSGKAHFHQTGSTSDLAIVGTASIGQTALRRNSSLPNRTDKLWLRSNTFGVLKTCRANEHEKLHTFRTLYSTIKISHSNSILIQPTHVHDVQNFQLVAKILEKNSLSEWKIPTASHLSTALSLMSLSDSLFFWWRIPQATQAYCILPFFFFFCHYHIDQGNALKSTNLPTQVWALMDHEGIGI